MWRFSHFAFAISTALLLAPSSFVVASTDPWINEFHYRPKENMFIEVAGPANQPADAYSIVLYQGRDGTQYPPVITLDNQVFDKGVDANAGIGFVVIPITKIHKGNQLADGIAITKDSPPTCIQFISYGGSFTAADGICQGVTSDDVGIEELRNVATAGTSIQLHGRGNTYKDFQWWNQLKTATPGAVNEGQVFASDNTPTGRRYLRA